MTKLGIGIVIFGIMLLLVGIIPLALGLMSNVYGFSTNLIIYSPYFIWGFIVGGCFLFVVGICVTIRGN